MILTLVAVSLTVSAAITSDTSGECGNGVNWSYTDTLFHRFTATEILTRDDLTIGSVIRLTKKGNQYRPDAWVSLAQKNTKRPGNVKTESVTVTEEWWGDFNYRAFNLSRSTDQNTITETETSALRIYIKVK